MASSSSSARFRRLISPKGIAGSCAIKSWFHRRGVRTAKTVVRNQDSSSSPLLMLPPESEEGGTTCYKFYSLAEKKLLVPTPTSDDDDDVIRKQLRLKCRGSSHGWLALLSPDNDGGFFLYNPISRRHIKLPSILNLPTWPQLDIYSSRRYVIKVILSCSPDEDEDNCRAVLVSYYSNPMAFCCPGRSKDWTLMLDEKIGDEAGLRYYKDCVYSTRRKLFFGLTADSVQTWDLRDPSSPRLLKVFNVNTIDLDYRYYDFSSLVSYAFDSVQHLVVVAEQDLLFVIQHIMFHVGTDGSCFAHLDESRPENCRYMTIGFDIYKYDPKKKRGGCLKYVDGSKLGGLALFVGMHSHSVAIPATQFPELRPNSIYFTDRCYTGRLLKDEEDDEPFRGHDIGIFNYEDKTVSPCYYPCDVRSLKKILPAPIWFFPSRPI